MASKRPVHGSGGRTKEIAVDLVGEGIRTRSSPNHALATVSIDANSALRIEISAANQYDWQLDVRIIGDSLDIGRVFCEGDTVREDDVPAWVERVAGVVGTRLAGGR